MKTQKYKKEVAPYIEGLERLKDIMLNETEFINTYTHYLDNFGEDREFKGICKTVKRPNLKAAMSTAGKQVTKGEGNIVHLMFVKLPGYPFLHATMFIDDRIATLIFFEDIGVGLMTIATPENTDFIRFSEVSHEDLKNLQTVH